MVAVVIVQATIEYCLSPEFARCQLPDPHVVISMARVCCELFAVTSCAQCLEYLVECPQARSWMIRASLKFVIVGIDVL